MPDNSNVKCIRLLEHCSTEASSWKEKKKQQLVWHNPYLSSSAPPKATDKDRCFRLVVGNFSSEFLGSMPPICEHVTWPSRRAAADQQAGSISDLRRKRKALAIFRVKEINYGSCFPLLSLLLKRSAFKPGPVARSAGLGGVQWRESIWTWSALSSQTPPQFAWMTAVMGGGGGC